jgi:hypothetical protein
MQSTASRKQRAIAAVVPPTGSDLDGIEYGAEHAIRPQTTKIVVAVVAHPITQLRGAARHGREILVAVGNAKA